MVQAGSHRGVVRVPHGVQVGSGSCGSSWNRERSSTLWHTGKFRELWFKLNQTEDLYEYSMAFREVQELWFKLNHTEEYYEYSMAFRKVQGVAVQAGSGRRAVIRTFR